MRPGLAELRRRVAEGRLDDRHVHDRHCAGSIGSSMRTSTLPAYADCSPRAEFVLPHEMERVTATIDDETLEKIRRVAGPRGVSSFLNVAARERLAHLELHS